jgi:hypothetical protein
MRLTRAALSIAAGAAALGLLTTACGSDHPGSPVDGNTGGANTSGSGNTGGLHLGNLGGTTGTITGGSSTGPIDECAGDLVEAKPIPLDIYVMLDQSGSMTLPTDSDPSITKWDAVSAALIAFVNDPESAGVGVGLQLFPHQHPDAPAECSSDQDCNGFGPCFTKTCWPPATEFLEPCQSGAECDLGMACVTFGVCANDTTYACPTIGEPCGREALTNRNLGNCIAPPPSVCLNTEDCRSSTYADPAAPIAALPGGGAAIVNVIQGVEPAGFTPTEPALAGAIEVASDYATAHPDHQVIAVLATDGLPSHRDGDGSQVACDTISVQSVESDLTALYQVARSGRAATPSVSTFVIGVIGADEVAGPGILNSIAQAGGTEKAFIVDTAGDVNAQFRAALNAIRAGRLSCELLVPEPAAGKTLDYEEVNVVYDDGTGPKDLTGYTDVSGCQDDVLGWHYDVTPDLATGQKPTRIVACPSTCAAFGRVQQGSVAIKLGCRTKAPVK